MIWHAISKIPDVFDIYESRSLVWKRFQYISSLGFEMAAPQRAQGQNIGSDVTFCLKSDRYFALMLLLIAWKSTKYVVRLISCPTRGIVVEIQWVSVVRMLCQCWLVILIRRSLLPDFKAVGFVMRSTCIGDVSETAPITTIAFFLCFRWQKVGLILVQRFKINQFKFLVN